MKTELPISHLLPGPLKSIRNRQAPRAMAYATPERLAILSNAALDAAMREISSWPGYAPTRLVALPGLAHAAGVGNLLYKDEGSRFGLGSFKALGGAYAVMRLLQRRLTQALGHMPAAAALFRGEYAGQAAQFTVACATDGNHGRSVAWGAQKAGCGCVIYVHEGVAQGRRDAIAAFGARVEEVKGTYDDAVGQAAKDAADHGWEVVSDTSYSGYTDIPRDVMQGYGVIMREAAAQWPDGRLPTHVFLQGGVGGFAASQCAALWESFGDQAPKMIVVEPDKAACLQLSAEAGKPVIAEGALDTIMAGLACGEVSLIAWDILAAAVDAFLTVSDAAAAATMRLLARSPYGDPSIVAGESAVAGLSGFLLAMQDAELRSALKLSPESIVMVVGTEGATDLALYEQIVGIPAAAVLS